MTDPYVPDKVYYKVSVKNLLNDGDVYYYLDSEFNRPEDAESIIRYYNDHEYYAKLEKFTVELIRYC
jgi:hypothetical protein